MKKRAIRCVVVSTTVDGETKARRLAMLVVKERLAACVQFAPIRSIYRWKGKIESASEYLLLAKTTLATAGRLAIFIRKHHDYELPEITVMPITGGLAGYLDWIGVETSSEKVSRGRVA